MKKIALIFAAVIGLSASSASAAIVQCPNPALPDPRDYFMLLNTGSASIAGSCWDYGAPGAATRSRMSSTARSCSDNSTVELPAGISTGRRYRSTAAARRSRVSTATALPGGSTWDLGERVVGAVPAVQVRRRSERPALLRVPSLDRRERRRVGTDVDAEPDAAQRPAQRAIRVFVSSAIRPPATSARPPVAAPRAMSRSRRRCCSWVLGCWARASLAVASQVRPQHPSRIRQRRRPPRGAPAL